MIEGLKVTMTGVQLRANVEERIQWHRGEIQRLSTLLNSPHRSIVEEPMPDGVLENAMRESERRIDVLTFIHDYVLADEVYRLGEFDLRFADLLPDDPPFDCGCLSASTVRHERAAPPAAPEQPTLVPELR